MKPTPPDLSRLRRFWLKRILTATLAALLLPALVGFLDASVGYALHLITLLLWCILLARAALHLFPNRVHFFWLLPAFILAIFAMAWTSLFGAVSFDHHTPR